MKRYLIGVTAIGAIMATALTVNAAVQDEDGAPQMRAAPAPEARYDIWDESRAGQPIQASVTFSGVLADARVSQMLTQSGAKPYAIHMFLDNRYGVHRAQPDEAAVDLIAKARADTIAMQDSKGKGIVERAKAVKANGAKADEMLKRMLPEAATTRRNALAGLRGGAPMIYGLEVVGTRDHLEALAGQPGVVSVTPGIILPNGAVAVGTPDAPAQKGNPQRRLSDADLDATIDRLAAGDLGE